MMPLNMKRVIAAVVFTTLLHGCVAQPPEPESYTLSKLLAAKVLPYDAPPQVIYRIDDSRYVTLEHYRDCHHGESFYNDAKQGIRFPLGRGTVENFRGHLINADPTGKNIVLPLSYPPETVCNDRGCTVPLYYSTDGGKTFGALVYLRNVNSPFRNSKDYTVAITKDKLFVVKKYQYRSDRPDHYDLLVDQYSIEPTHPLRGPSDGAWESKKKLMPDGLRTPSGQDQIICDPSIKPTNPDAPLVP